MKKFIPLIAVALVAVAIVFATFISNNDIISDSNDNNSGFSSDKVATTNKGKKEEKDEKELAKKVDSSKNIKNFCL